MRPYWERGDLHVWLVWMRSYWSRVGSNLMTSVLIKRGDLETDIHIKRRIPEDWHYAMASQNYL
jgi:hypothetical protein